MSSITTLTGLFKSHNALQIYRLSALLCLFILFNHTYLLISHLDDHGFRQNILFFSVLQRLGWMGSSVLTFSVVIGLYYGRFFIAWSELENGLALRRFITADVDCSGLLAAGVCVCIIIHIIAIDMAVEYTTRWIFMGNPTACITSINLILRLVSA